MQEKYFSLVVESSLIAETNVSLEDIHETCYKNPVPILIVKKPHHGCIINLQRYSFVSFLGFPIIFVENKTSIIQEKYFSFVVECILIPETNVSLEGICKTCYKKLAPIVIRKKYHNGCIINTQRYSFMSFLRFPYNICLK
jgi:hypothetical protein